MSRLFRGVTDAARQLILTSALPLNLKKGQRLFERGDPGGTMYVVMEGRIEISIVSANGRKISLNLISAGNCFGEVNMVDNRERTASAVAVEPTVLQPIGRSTFFAAARLCPELAITIAEILCERVRWVSELGGRLCAAPAGSQARSPPSFASRPVFRSRRRNRDCAKRSRRFCRSNARVN